MEAVGAPVSGSLRTCLRLHPSWPWLAMPERQIVQVATDKSLALVPNTPAWFLGVLNLRGVLIPAFDVALWAGAPPTHSSYEYALLSPGERGIALRCVSLPELATVATNPQAQPVTMLPDALHPYLSDIGQSASLGPIAAFDPWHWMDQCRQNLSQSPSA